MLKFQLVIDLQPTKNTRIADLFMIIDEIIRVKQNENSSQNTTQLPV
jgi:hypothetical protein